MKKNKALFLDIMLNNRFVCTLKYMYCPLFVIRYEELLKFVLDKETVFERQTIQNNVLKQQTKQSV